LHFDKRFLGLSFSGNFFQCSFIELAKTIRNHTTLIKLNCRIIKCSPGTKTAMLLEALKDNRSIKSLSLYCDRFDANTAHIFGQTLINNQTWHTLSMLIYSSPATSGLPTVPHFGV